MKNFFNITLPILLSAALLTACSSQNKPQTHSADNLVNVIRNRGKLIAGVNYLAPGISYFNATTNRFEGFEADIARQIAKKLLGSEDKIEFVIAVPINRTPYLEAGIVDIIVAELIETHELEKEIEMSDVYFLAVQTLMVRKGSPITSISDVNGKVIAVTGNTASVTNLQKIAPNAKLLIVDSLQDAFQALKYNKADAISGPEILLKVLRTRDQQPDQYVVLENFFAEEPWVIGIKKGQLELLKIVNETLQEIKQSGIWEQIYNNNLKPITGYTMLPPL